MTTCLAFLAVGAIGFTLGWKGNDWWKRQQANGKGIDVLKPKLTPFGVVWVISFAIFIASVWFLDYRTGDKVSDSEARQNDRNTAQLACLSRAFEDFLTGNQALRDTSADRDRALVRSKLTMARITELRIGERKDDNPKLRAKIEKHMPDWMSFYDDVQRMQQEYVQTVIDYDDASEDLDEARKTYKLPDFEERCGKLPPEMRGAFYQELKQPPWQAQITGSSFE